MNIERQKILDWMKLILSETKWSPEEWARRAGVSGTTITEFMTGRREFLPSTATLTKLGKASGFHLELVRDSDYHHSKPREQRIPLMTKAMLMGEKSKNEQWLELPSSQDLLAIENEIENMTAAAIKPGDKLIVDKSREPRPGDLVAYYHPEYGVGAGHFYPPMIVHADGHTLTILNNNEPTIVGRITQLIRTF